LRFLRGDPRARLNRLQVGVANGERDHVENVLVAEPRCLLGGSRRSESLDGFEAEDGLAQARTHRAVAERSNNSGNSCFYPVEPERREVQLLDSLGCAGADLRKQRAQRQQPLPSRDLRVFPGLDRGEVVAHCHVDGVAKGEGDHLLRRRATRHASGDCSVLRIGRGNRQCKQQCAEDR
jgi:hypothetical protein